MRGMDTEGSTSVTQAASPANDAVVHLNGLF